VLDSLAGDTRVTKPHPLRHSILVKPVKPPSTSLSTLFRGDLDQTG